jgi:hypothetical protein
MNFPEFKPADNQAELEEFYSKHRLGTSGKPTATILRAPIIFHCHFPDQRLPKVDFCHLCG